MRAKSVGLGRTSKAQFLISTLHSSILGLRDYDMRMSPWIRVREEFNKAILGVILVFDAISMTNRSVRTGCPL